MKNQNPPKQELTTGCATSLCYIPAIAFAVGGCFCLPFGLILIGVGVGWYFMFRSEIKKAKERAQTEAERQRQLQIIRENTNDELCEKTLAVIEQGQEIATLDSDFAGLTLLQKEHTLNKAFEEIVKKGTEDGIITEEEEKAISTFADHFGVSEQKFEQQDWYEQYIKLLTLKDLMNGIVPQRRAVETGFYMLNLAKGEELVWRFDDIEYFEEVKRTHYEGSSSGISVRIAKGVYYRTGAMRGRPVTTTEMKQKAVGTLFVATKHLYFYSEQKTVKIPYNKVIAFTPYSDGLGIQKDTATAKPQAFRGLDGWFAFNLVSNISNL